MRQRIEAVLDWANVQNYRHGDNPARWEGCFELLLPAPGKIKKVRRMPALPYARMPEFLVELRKQHGVAARALEFGILSASRPGEVLGATWDEFDQEESAWLIPPEDETSQRTPRATERESPRNFGGDEEAQAR